MFSSFKTDFSSSTVRLVYVIGGERGLWNNFTSIVLKIFVQVSCFSLPSLLSSSLFWLLRYFVYPCSPLTVIWCPSTSSEKDCETLPYKCNITSTIVTRDVFVSCHSFGLILLCIGVWVVTRWVYSYVVLVCVTKTKFLERMSVCLNTV